MIFYINEYRKAKRLGIQAGKRGKSVHSCPFGGSLFGIIKADAWRQGWDIGIAECLRQFNASYAGQEHNIIEGNGQ